MRRRQFITNSGAALLAAPALAQQGQRVRHVGVITNLAQSDPEGQARIAALEQGLQKLGWHSGRNIRFDHRWPVGDSEQIRRHAAEIVEIAPDVIVAGSSPVVVALQQLRTGVPVVFVNVIDPVGGGFAASLNRPGGRFTGFTAFEYGISSKWLEVLKEIAPHVTRVGVIRDPTTAAGGGQLGAIQAVAPLFRIEPAAINERSPSEIERGVGDFARKPNGGLVVTAAPLTTVYRKVIIELAARYRLPAVYPFRFFADAGGLISYGPDLVDPYRLAAGYVDRILKGDKPADLPVQAPTKFDLVVNIKTANALGLVVPTMLVSSANHVIE